jgi:hypothetical protein
MADRFLIPLLVRLRFSAANLPALPLIAFVLVVAAALTHLFLLPSREAAIEESEQRLVKLERNARRTVLEHQTERTTPEETRLLLLNRFPTEAQLNAELGSLIEMAGKEGLQVPSGDYRLVPGKDGLFDRYVLTLPVKGGYQTIRHYVAAVRKEFPDLAVEDISLRRENIGTSQVEAQLRFILFGRRSAA